MRPSLICQVGLNLRYVVKCAGIVPMSRIPPSDASPHYFFRRALGIAGITCGCRIVREVANLAFEACSLLASL